MAKKQIEYTLIEYKDKNNVSGKSAVIINNISFKNSDQIATVYGTYKVLTVSSNYGKCQAVDAAWRNKENARPVAQENIRKMNAAMEAAYNKMIARKPETRHSGYSAMVISKLANK
jgi:hypothetical protein